jgi:hypothetical protein
VGHRDPAAVRDFAKPAIPGSRRAMSPNQAGQGAPRRPDNLNLWEEDHETDNCNRRLGDDRLGGRRL